MLLIENLRTEYTRFSIISNKNRLSVQLKLRGIINGMAGKTATFTNFSDMLTYSYSGGVADYANPLVLPHLKISLITPMKMKMSELHTSIFV